jgi:hypothetical protein
MVIFIDWRWRQNFPPECYWTSIRALRCDILDDSNSKTHTYTILINRTRDETRIQQEMKKSMNESGKKINKHKLEEEWNYVTEDLTICDKCKNYELRSRKGRIIKNSKCDKLKRRNKTRKRDKTNNEIYTRKCILSRSRGDYRRGLDWWMDLHTTRNYKKLQRYR